MFEFNGATNTAMSINNMKNRLRYNGGKSQVARMDRGKLKSLQKAIESSYHSATAILPSGNEFRCLINPDKLSPDMDSKIISIPYFVKRDKHWAPDDEKEVWEDMEDLDSPECNMNLIPTRIKEGDVIFWKETRTNWIVLLQHVEETAYFRASLRRCRQKIELDNGSVYWVYVRGPVEQTATWATARKETYNKLNYSLLFYITKNDETLDYFHRFTKITLDGQPWEVQMVDSISTPGIIEIALKEDFNNSIKNDVEEVIFDIMEKEYEELEKIEAPRDTEEPYIQGKVEIYPYDTVRYTLVNHWGGGTWSVLNESRSNMIKLTSINDLEVEITVLTGRSGEFTLGYIHSGETAAAVDIKVLSL